MLIDVAILCVPIHTSKEPAPNSQLPLSQRCSNTDAFIELQMPRNQKMAVGVILLLGAL